MRRPQQIESKMKGKSTNATDVPSSFTTNKKQGTTSGHTKESRSPARRVEKNNIQQRVQKTSKNETQTD
jgi:hypothetical protein